MKRKRKRVGGWDSDRTIEDLAPCAGPSGNHPTIVRRNIKQVETELKEVLGSTYGGPSISYEDGKFVIYQWGDAPVGMDVLAKGDSIQECLENLRSAER